MTKRSLENRLESLKQEAEDDDSGIMVVYQDGDVLRTPDGEQVYEDDLTGVVIATNQSHVMPRGDVLSSVPQRTRLMTP